MWSRVDSLPVLYYKYYELLKEYNIIILLDVAQYFTLASDRKKENVETRATGMQQPTDVA
jgi:hypothetical protein